jgi:hypothetical protein
MGQEKLSRWDMRSCIYGPGEFDRMGQEKMISWDRRS